MSDELVDTDLSGIDLIVSFLMQAEDLANGKHQKKVVFDVVEQFSGLVIRMEELTAKLKNLEDSHAKSLNFIRYLKRKQNNGNGEL